MSFRLAPLRHLFGLVLLLGALLLGSAGAVAGVVHASAHGGAEQAGAVLNLDALDQVHGIDQAPAQPPLDGDDDDRCALEDHGFDDTLQLPEHLVMNLQVIAPVRLTGPVPALAGAPLAMELRPPIV